MTKYISLTKGTISICMDRTRKNKKLYYSYKISLQQIPTNYKLQYEYGFDRKLRNKIRFHLS